MRKISIQKIFIFFSILFILICIGIYSSRFAYFYMKNKHKDNKKTIAQIIKNNNVSNKNFKMISSAYYFTNDSNNNYFLYSGILYRIIKIDKDENIVMISDDSVTSLALGKNTQYSKTEVNKWLNNVYSKNLTKDNLTSTNVCLDNLNKPNNSECKKRKKYDIGLLNIQDYINTGSTKSFINNEQIFYLSQTNKSNEIWYSDETGKLGSSDGTEIYGIKPVITLSKDTLIKDGDGTKEKPYTVNEENYFGKYVKLGNDLWRIYDINNNDLKLSLNNKLTDTYAYSNKDYNYSLIDRTSLAYYLNTTYLNSLTYQDKIKESTYSNSFYGEDNDFNYEETLNKTITAKIGLLSIGNIIFNKELNNYSLMTGTNTDGSLTYIVSSDGTLSVDSTTSELNIVPCITIDKSILTKGKGSIDEPFEME